jgi:hypothetical protein
MRAALRIGACLLAVAPLVALADDEPKLSCIKDVRYSEDFLQKYPNAAAACREVVVKNGEKWVRFEANVASVKGNEVTADFVDPTDQVVSTLTFATPKDATIVVDGKKTRYSDLSKGDRLYVWMPEKRAAFYTEPQSSNSQKLAVVNVVNTPAQR